MIAFHHRHLLIEKNKTKLKVIVSAIRLRKPRLPRRVYLQVGMVSIAVSLERSLCREITDKRASIIQYTSMHLAGGNQIVIGLCDCVTENKHNSSEL